MTKMNIFAHQNNLVEQAFFARQKKQKNELALQKEVSGTNNPVSTSPMENFFQQFKALDQAANQGINNFQQNPAVTRQPTTHVNPTQSLSGKRKLSPEEEEKNRKKIKKMADNRSKAALMGLKAKVNSLKSSVYQGSTSALKELDKIASGSGDPRFQLLNKNDLGTIMTLGKESLDELSNNADRSPKLLGTFIQAKKQNRVGISAEKLIGDSAFSSGALQTMTKLINNGLKLDDHIKKAMGTNPAKAIWGLTYLADQNIPKSARLSIAQALSNTAKDKGGSYLGQQAAKGLKRIIKQEGQNSISDQAFSGLKEAGTAGNNFALQYLEDIANDHTVSYNKATKAVKALSGVAQDNPNGPSGGNAVKCLYRVINKQGENSILRAAFKGLKEASMKGNSKAVDALGSVALNSNLSLNKANKAINALGDVVQSGQGHAPKALNVLKVLATDKGARGSVKRMARNKLQNLGVSNEPGNFGIQDNKKISQNEEQDPAKKMHTFATQQS